MSLEYVFPQVGLVAFAFMITTTTEAYREVFRCLKEQVPNLIIPAYMGDFDSAMRGAVKAEFPGCHLYGCYFHYTQALWKYARGPKVGLATELRKKDSAWKMLVRFTALPLLPPHEISSTFDNLASQALALDQRFLPFVRYMKKQWMQKIGPLGISVYRALSRTNNNVESNNALLLRRVNKVHGPIWDLVGECNYYWPA